MKTLLLILTGTLILIPLSLLGGGGNQAQIRTTHSIDWCSTEFYYSSVEYDELRFACFNLIEDYATQQTDITASIHCVGWQGTCEGFDTRAYCQTDNPGPYAIQVVNNNKIIVDLQPEDCDSSLNAVGTQFSASYNGEVSNSFDYGDFRANWINKEGTHCKYMSEGGKQEERYADIVANIEGVDVAGKAFIRTITTDDATSNCPY